MMMTSRLSTVFILPFKLHTIRFMAKVTFYFGLSWAQVFHSITLPLSLFYVPCINFRSHACWKCWNTQSVLVPIKFWRFKYNKREKLFLWRREKDQRHESFLLVSCVKSFFPRGAFNVPSLFSSCVHSSVLMVYLEQNKKGVNNFQLESEWIIWTVHVYSICKK